MAGRGGKTPGAGRKPGIPNKASGEVKALARQYGPAVIKRLAQFSGVLLDDKGNLLKGAESEATQAIAMKELLDRGYGKATQLIAGDDSEPPVAMSMKVKFVRPS